MGPFGLSEIILILAFFFWTATLVDCVTKESSQGNTKIAVSTNVIGAALYWIIRRTQLGR